MKRRRFFGVTAGFFGFLFGIKPEIKQKPEWGRITVKRKFTIQPITLEIDDSFLPKDCEIAADHFASRIAEIEDQAAFARVV